MLIIKYIEEFEGNGKTKGDRTAAIMLPLQRSVVLNSRLNARTEFLNTIRDYG